ncbi:MULTISPECIES: tyrosine-type recombinase/integrase [unclassified Arenibacter]|uniref:tyrosine-type recombinase/integrase n=1 Tax=unclassified Arenibacter TaxID=2615047 RepID=UPI000E354165|nr:MULTISPECIES: tyrosine-type recombinase/integrase [unclassified Arenibacter]MCM4162984.1 integrase [Arenibacter sp. A80]RFT57023.1 integrase [Arenibacter sp. P308M17]
MRYTFNLKNPKDNKLTLIYFSTYFKMENKKFVYSTGESILPSEWDFQLRQPNDITGRSSRAQNHRSIKMQLDRYSNYFLELVNRFKHIGEELDIETTRNHFNTHFKKTKPLSNKFFEVYEVFLETKRNDFSGNANSPSTIARYKYNKKLLKMFQEYSKKQLNINKLDLEFYNAFINYCVTVMEHSANTLRRNVGLFKTFMNWALENEYTYNTDFKKFKSPSPQATQEVALTLDQVKVIFDHDFSNNLKLERVRDLFVFGCATGMRISNYSSVKKEDIINGHIQVVDAKNKTKNLKIPLNDFSMAILEKYNYELPKISTQKFNKYIKEVFIAAKFNDMVKKTTRVGNVVTEVTEEFNQRVSSHTARRSFITIMKNKKIPDKVIMEFTGHRSLEVFNKYYKPNEDDKKEFMTNVWSLNQ